MVKLNIKIFKKFQLKMHIKKRGGLSKVFCNSRAQATIFLVISTVILLAGLLYFIYQKQLSEAKAEVVGPELQPVKVYVDNCIQQAAEDGLQRIGLSGGYINVPSPIASNPSAYLSDFPSSAFKRPYWWHDGIAAIPTEEFVKDQLIGHIKRELKSCINDFEPFKSRFEITEIAQEPSVDIRFNENDVSVKLKYPLEISARDGTFKGNMENFLNTIRIRFKKIYEIAKLIMERENNDYFVERRTIDLYSLDTEIPTTDIEATCRTKVWQMSNIKEKLQTLLRVNLPYIRVKGTSYNPDLYVPLPTGTGTYQDSYYQQHYVWELSDDMKNYRNIKITFNYDNWPMQIYARPSQNELLKSNSQKGSDLLNFFCLHIWHFTYDVKYPVIATIFDPETSNNKAYWFSFAFKVDIDHNQPNRINRGTLLFDTAETVSTDEYCSDVENEITLFTVNNATGDDVADVNLTFVCGRYYCDIGKSEPLSFGAAIGVSKKLPYCVNGIVKGTKSGFADAQAFVQTDVDGRSYILDLNPVKEIENFKVVKHPLSNPLIEEELDLSEKASIVIKGKDTSFEGFAVYPKETAFPLKIPRGIDAEYEVTIYLVNEDDIIGGYVGDWQISKEQLENANQVVFHAIEQGSASQDERSLFLSSLASYSQQIPAPEIR